jgi:hypothetical protein
VIVNRHTNDLYDRCAALRQRSARLRADIAALHNDHIRMKEQRRRASATGGAIFDAPATTPHDAAMEALKAIRAVLDAFPLEWQIAIVKALTARTLVKAHERTRPAQAALSA